MMYQQPQISSVTTTSTIQNDQWSTGICGCFDDCEICCFATWCPVLFTCSTTSNLGECFCLPLIDEFSIIPPISMALRTSVRARYGIQGDLGSDCMYVTFCNICSWCQIARELKRRHPNHIVVNVQSAVMPAPPVMVPVPQPTVVTTQVTRVG
ncbi:cornifelin-like [Pseudorasbora parva]|uniref:cornifelin-like n=1 Tax=Pseudorasbora parva TaxID=51549 RepID=UPI00351E2B57